MSASLGHLVRIQTDSHTGEHNLRKTGGRCAGKIQIASRPKGFGD